MKKMDDSLKKVLYISYDGLTDPLGQSQVLPYLEQLAKDGYQFTILSFEKKDRFAKEASVVKKIISAASMDWVPLKFTSNPPVLSKIYDRFQMRRKALELHAIKSFDLVHCRSYVAAEIGLDFKKKFGVPFLFDMRGFWADEKVDNGQWNLRNPFFKLVYKHYKSKEKKFLQFADVVISLTAAAKDFLLQKKMVKPSAIKVIPCCADLEHFDYEKVSDYETDKVRLDLNLDKDSKVITYLGSIGGWYMTKEMLRFVKLLQNRQPEYVMLFLTKDDPQKIRQEAAEAGININRIRITYASRKQLPVFLRISTVSIFFIRNTFSKMASSPTKHGELMGMGIPVICNDIGDTGEIIHTTRTGIIVNDFADSSFKKIIDNITTIEQMDRFLIRSQAHKIFSLASGVDQYLSAYQSILKKPVVA